MIQFNVRYSLEITFPKGIDGMTVKHAVRQVAGNSYHISGNGQVGDAPQDFNGHLVVAPLTGDRIFRDQLEYPGILVESCKWAGVLGWGDTRDPRIAVPKDVNEFTDRLVEYLTKG